MEHHRRRHRALLCILAISATIGAALFACEGSALDVGVANESGDGLSPDSATPFADVGDTRDVATVVGLTVDGIQCSSSESGLLGDTPSFTLAITGNCGALGTVRGLVESRLDLDYPRACDASSTISWGLDDEGDAGGLYYYADATRGSCTMESGPTTVNRSRPLFFNATVVHTRNPNLTHRIVYRPQDDTVLVGRGDASQGPD